MADDEPTAEPVDAGGRVTGPTIDDPWPWEPYTWAEFRTRGLLWLVNACALHPRGYAIQVHWPEGTTDEAKMDGSAEPSGWSIVGDGSEPWYFADSPDHPGYLDALFAAVADTLAEATHRTILSNALKAMAAAADEGDGPVSDPVADASDG